MADRMLGRGVVTGFLGAMLIIPATASADAVLDGSTGSTGSFSGNFEVPAAVGRQAGGNLFHSFERFSVLRGESATFTGPAGIDNVISRVTGGDVSTIDGELASTVPGADFFFLNPAGVVFGPEASLDVDGSFHVSTADELRFDDGSIFSASNPDASSFTVAAPEAFGFLGAEPAAITVDGSLLTVLPNERLELSGGDIDISGSLLFAPSGAIDLEARGEDGDVSIREAAVVSVEGDGGGRVNIRARNLTAEDRSAILAPNIGTAVQPGGVDIRLSGVLTLKQSLIGAGSFDGPTDGVVIEAAKVVLDGGQIDASSFSGGQTAGITIDASERLVIKGPVRLDQPGVTLLGTRPGLFAIVRGTGAGGDITVRAGTLVITDAGVIEATTRNAGAGGSITLFAEGGLNLSEGAAISAEAFAGGAAGDVTITALSLELDESFIGANSRESALAGADAGTVTIDAGRIEFINDGRIFNGTDGPGNGGDIIVRAGTIEADVGADPTPFHTGISATANPGSSGVGGDVVVTADQIRLLNGGEITSGTSGGGAAGDVTLHTRFLHADAGFIGASSGASAGANADAGTVTIEADRIEFINDGRIFNGTDGLGDGGDIIVRAGTIEADVGADPTPFHTGISATANSGSSGVGGDVVVTADQILLINGGLITSATNGEGAAGDVTLHTRVLRADAGFIGTNTRASAGANADAGTVTIEADRIDFINDGRVFNGTDGRGNGGDIIVTAGTIEADVGTDPTPFHTGISASANLGSTGDGGEVTVSADRILLRNGGEISSDTDSVGSAGEVRVFAERIELEDGGRIFTTSTGSGDAGDVLVSADRLSLSNGEISTEANIAGGGRIVLVVDRLLDLNGSNIATSVFGGSDTTAGDITIDPQFVVLNGSRIVAQAREGAGGNIRIVTDHFFTTPDSVVDASSDLGIDGTVEITAPDLDLTSELAVLPTAYIDVSGLLRESCAARASAQTSSFVSAGSRGLAPGPTAPLAGTYASGTPRDAAFPHWTSVNAGDCHD